MNVLQYLLARAKEPSSMAGLTALAALFLPDPMKADAVVQVVLAVVGLVAVFRPEGK